ncbi:PucR family transcriptional regulator [Streptomyces sp. NPDC093589]|uniref:PucR family transcriptional regulator n=1 Tax=Streptomyces sp. NPDC093589 TaxID=3366043 RepID=UPI003829763C
MSDPVNSIRLPQSDDEQAECRLRPTLAELVTETMSHRNPGFEAFVERAGREQVTRLLEEVLRGALACGAPAPAQRRPLLTSCGNDSQLPTPATQASGPKAESVRRADPEQARRALFDALTSRSEVPAAALRELSRRADWPLPDTVRAVALRSAADIRLVASALGDCLVSPPGQQACLLVPGPVADDRAKLTGVLRCRSATVGHAVPPQDTPASVRWAFRLLDMAASSEGPVPGPVFVDDHLSLLVLLQDESLARVLVARRLRPLAGLTPERCARLEATLLAWLGGGGAPEVAKALSIHPQTVRYRMRQIEKLFGARLRDPRARFEIEMALRSRQLMDKVRRHRPDRGGRARSATRPPWKAPIPITRQAGLNGL